MNNNLILGLIVSICLILSYLSFCDQHNEKTQDTIFQRKSFKKHIKNINSTLLQSNEEDYNILTYSVSLDLGLQEGDSIDGQNSFQKNEIKTTAHIMFDYIPETKQFDIVVAYSKYHQESLQNTDTFSMQKNQKLFSSNQDSYTYQNTLVYKLLVEEESGDILSMYVPNSSHQNELVQWGTQELINNIFPDIRSGSYIDATPMEQDSIGKFQPHLKQIVTSEEIAQLEKHYDSKDYSQFEVEGVIAPAVDYNRTLFVDIDSGVVLGGNSEYEYSISQNKDNQKLQNVQFKTEFQSFNIGIKTNFYLQTEDYYTKLQAQNLLKFIQNSENQFIQIQLAKNKKAQNFQKIQENSHLQQKNLKQSKVFQQSADLFEYNVLNQNLQLELDVLVQSTQSTASANIKVNNFQIYTLYSYSIDHCYEVNQTYSDKNEINLFNVEWQVAGLINVPVSATIIIDYKLIMEGIQNNDKCQYSIKPYFKGELIGDGRATIPGVISAGIYAKGHIIDSYLSLEMNLEKQNGQAGLQLNGIMEPTTFELGGLFYIIVCDYQKLFSFEWNTMCRAGEEVLYPFIYNTSERSQKEFWKQSLHY